MAGVACFAAHGVGNLYRIRGIIQSDRAYPRAGVFFRYFQDCPSIDEASSGQDAWSGVDDVRAIRRGDVVSKRLDGEHTGHIWVAMSTPDANGSYDAIESTGSRGGVCQTSYNI